MKKASRRGRREGHARARGLQGPAREASAIPADALTLSGVVAAFVAGFSGYPTAGLCVAAIALAGHLAYLARSAAPRLLYRPSFRDWGWVLGLWVGAVVASGGGRFGTAIATGAMVYHYACVCLCEGAVRYVPWAAGFSWRIARSNERPAVYWGFVALFSALGMLLLLGPLAVCAVELGE